MNINTFNVSIYGNFTPYSETISKARCRIFYKYGNRNGTYITDEFAEKLISTIAYAPVKGIYQNDDFSDHGEDRDEGRIYGIVPENYNFAWETHLDEDGVEREYACVDVLVYTALYKEAADIIGKPQSMEIYDKSIVGEWKMIDGKKYYVFEDGCFLGLQVLGDTVEPCFEGAQFFSLYQSVMNEINKLGGKEMHNITFKLSDNQKYDAIWDLLNTEYNEENGWVVTYMLCEIYDDYALAYNLDSGEYERVYYIKDEDSVTINKKKKCYVIDVTEEEKVALDNLRKFNNDTYENIDTTFNKVTQELQQANDTISEFTGKFETLNTELNSLRQYKLSVDNAEKNKVIESYKEKISDETLNSFSANIDKYTVDELKKELAYSYIEANPAIFQKQETPIPKVQETSGVIALLEQHKNKNS